MKCPYCGKENPLDMNFCTNCGRPLLLATHSKSSTVQFSQQAPLKLEVNVLSLIGAVLAVISLSMPWVVVQREMPFIGVTRTEFSAYDFDSDFAKSFFSSSPAASITIFMIGAVLAFLSPLAGLPLATGFIGFTAAILSHEYPSNPPTAVTLWTGCGLGCVSTVLVVLSVVFPLWIGRGREEELGVLARLLTWIPYR